MDTQRRAMIAFVLAACVIMTALSLGVHRAEPPAPAKLRIGTYDNRAVAIAYHRSSAADETRKAMQAELEQAKKDGQQKRVEQLKRAFDRMQWTAHRQGFGTASVDEAMASVKDKLPDLATKAKVCAVVCNPDYLAMNEVERVDLTDQVVALFAPDEKTLQIVDQMKKAAPVQVGFDFED